MVTVRRLERERYLLALASNRLASPKAVMTTPPRLNVARSDTPASNSTESDRRILPTVHNRHRVARKPVAREAPAKLEQRLVKDSLRKEVVQTAEKVMVETHGETGC
jgi:hypothetical protein